MGDRGSLAVLFVVGILIVVACGDDRSSSVSLTSPSTSAAPSATSTTASPGTATTATTAPSPGPVTLAPPASGEAPASWYAVEHRGDRFVLVRGTTDGGPTVDLGSVADDAGAPDTSLPQSVDDLAVDPEGGSVYLALCCEPVSGVVLALPTDTPGDAASFDQGRHVDVADVYVRSDTEGVLRWTRGAPAPTSDHSIAAADAVDVAVGHGPEAEVAALVASTGEAPSGIGDRVVSYGADGAVVATVDLGGPHCALATTSAGFVATVGEPERSEHAAGCSADVFTVVNEGVAGTAQLAVGLQDLESDASGEHLIGVDGAGNVVRIGAGDEVQALTEGRLFVAVDW